MEDLALDNVTFAPKTVLGLNRRRCMRSKFQPRISLADTHLQPNVGQYQNPQEMTPDAACSFRRRCLTPVDA
jgi:hypothetical protein